MRVLLTGGAGFLGWHLRVRLRALADHEVAWVDRQSWPTLQSALSGVDAVIHLAGINRAVDTELLDGNRELAEQVVAAAQASGATPRLVYANSIQADNDSPYGRGKAAASAVFADAARRWGTPFVDVLLPNLFGEHGRPGYNSFVATFVDRVVAGEPPTVEDRPISLLHAQDAAASLIAGLEGETRVERPEGVPTTVQSVLDHLLRFKAAYATGQIPMLASPFELALFNTYRAALFPSAYPIAFTTHSDNRGWLVETARWFGGEGQTFVSVTKPGFTRGEHFHLRKIERFVVLAGTARIALRKVDTDEVVVFDVSGDAPSAIDMPVGWIHNIRNVGDSDVLTQFWVNELFDPEDPDTFWEPVEPKEAAL